MFQQKKNVHLDQLKNDKQEKHQMNEMYENDENKFFEYSTSYLDRR
jgi:hypothetical protein